MKRIRSRMSWRLALACLLAMGAWQGVNAQVTNPPEPALPSVPPPSVPQPGGQEGFPGAIVGSKLDQVLQSALEQLADRSLNAFELMKGLGLDADSRLRVLVDVEFLGEAAQIESRIEELNGLLSPNRLGFSGVRARVPISRLNELGEEIAVIQIRAVVAFAAALPPTQDIGLPLRQISVQALESIRAALNEKRARTTVQKKLDSGLVLALKRRQNLSIAGGALDRVQAALTEDQENRVLVEISLNAVDPSVVSQIQQLGGEVSVQVDRFRSIQAWLAIQSIEALAEHDAVRRIRRTIPPVSRIHNRSEGDIRHRADVVRREFGFDGTGVKVGGLSNGVDTLFARQGNGDLPSEIVVLDGQHGIGDEGTAIMEIVNDLAPGVGLMFASGFPSEAQMAQNILDLAEAGCDVIVDDVGHHLAPVFQDGPAAQAVESVYQQGVAYFSAAGNAGSFDAGTSGVWEGGFAGAELSIEGQTYLVHDFGGGVLFNELRTDPRSVIALHWADPLGGSANDYDLFLLDESGTEIVALSDNVQDGSGDPLEFIDSRLEDHTWYRVVVVQSAGDDRYLRLDTFGSDIEFVTPGQVFGHPAAENAIAVGAVYQGNGLFGPGYFDGDELVESFSSDGPRRVFFSSNGVAYTPGNMSESGGVVRAKPNFVAADGVSTNTPFFEQFFGTSAAAPHAAAIGALLMERGVNDPQLIRRLFEATAIDVEVPGFDRKSGHGIVDAYKAMMSPIAVDDSLIRVFESLMILDAASLLENDLAGLGEGQLDVSGVSPASEMGGAVSLESGLISYRPRLGFHGLDRFEYTLAEDGASTIQGIVEIEVLPAALVPLELIVQGSTRAVLSLQVNGSRFQNVLLEQAPTLDETSMWSEVSTFSLDKNGRSSLEISTRGETGFLRVRPFVSEQ